MEHFLEGMHKVGESMCAAISASVTRDAQEKRTLDGK